jgi:hypothetical protein
VADRVVFLRPDAERIARAVRTVEAGNRNETPLTFRRVGGEGGGKEKVFRVCTFTGAWAINASKTITFRGVTATPNTVSAINLFAAVPAPSGSGNCAIAKDGTAWYLIAAQCS